MTHFKTELADSITTLISQREVWENGLYKQANAELYSILEKCSIIYAELRNDKSNLNAFKAIADELGINFGKGTSLALKIVRIVFGQQSNREFAYARVIKIGFEQKAETQTLTNFIIEHGGIENVRRSVGNDSTKKLSPDDYREIAEETFIGATAITSFNIASYMLCDKDKETDYLVALVHCDGNGVGRVVCGSNKRSLVNNALAIMGKDIDDLQQEQASKVESKDKKQQTADNVKQFLTNSSHKKIAA